MLALALVACQVPAQELSPEDAASARRTITAWLECEECVDGEREAVVALGGIALPTLVAVLREGPSPARREEMRRHLERVYRELRESGAELAAGSPEEYAQRYLGNFEALYRIRAAEGLGAIGGGEARRALEEALRQDLREDVAAAVRAALEGGR
jgi:hypothetical protein